MGTVGTSTLRRDKDDSAKRATVKAGMKRKPLRDAARTRERLLKAATAEFAARGLEGARVDEIAKRARINKQLVYHYFGSKENLYTAVLEDAYARFRSREKDLITGPTKPQEAVENLVNVLLDSFILLPDVVSLIADENVHKARHIQKSKKIKALHSDLMTLTRAILKNGEETGTFRSGVDPLWLLISILGLCSIYVSNRYTLSAIYERDLTDPVRTEEWKNHVVDFVLHALMK